MNTERRQKRHERKGEAVILEARESTSDSAQGVNDSTRANLREPITVPASAPRRDSPWVLIQSVHSKRAAHPQALRREALIRTQARLLEKARWFKHEGQTTQVQRKAEKMRSLLAWHEAQGVRLIEALQRARQACLRSTTGAGNE